MSRTPILVALLLAGCAGPLFRHETQLVQFGVDTRGLPEIWGLDMDHDGRVDAWEVDTDSDGIVDRYVLDLDRDGRFDVDLRDRGHVPPRPLLLEVELPGVPSEALQVLKAKGHFREWAVPRGLAARPPRLPDFVETPGRYRWPADPQALFADALLGCFLRGEGGDRFLARLDVPGERARRQEHGAALRYLMALDAGLRRTRIEHPQVPLAVVLYTD